MLTVPIDFRQYVLSLRISGPLATPLAQKLVNAAPADLDEGERAALDQVVRAATDVDDIRSERERSSPAKVRPLMSSIVESWGPLHDMLAATSRLSARHGDRGPRAQRIVGSIFPEGMTFVTLEADAVWSETRRRLQRIDQEGLRSEIEALAGAEVLAAARAATDALGEALGNGKSKRRIPSKASLQRALVRFSRAVGNYCRILSAKVDEEDAAKVERFRQAVAPIDEYRASHPALRSDAEEEVIEEPEEPVVDQPVPPVAPPTA